MFCEVLVRWWLHCGQLSKYSGRKSRQFLEIWSCGSIVLDLPNVNPVNVAKTTVKKGRHKYILKRFFSFGIYRVGKSPVMTDSSDNNEGEQGQGVHYVFSHEQRSRNHENGAWGRNSTFRNNRNMSWKSQFLNLKMQGILITAKKAASFHDFHFWKFFCWVTSSGCRHF